MNGLVRTLGAMLAALLALAFLAMPAFAQASQDSVNGSGTAGNGTFTLNATSGPSGENPAGTVGFNLAIGTLSGNVTCLNVEGNKATIGGVPTGGSLLPQASGFVVDVQDGSPDLLRLELLGFPPPACPAPNLFSPSVVEPGGGITVVDAVPQSPPPTVPALIEMVNSFNLDSGRTTSLLAPLKDVDQGSQSSRCNSLNAFTNEVKAQRGKDLTASQANDLVQQATAVRANLGCSP